MSRSYWRETKPIIEVIKSPRSAEGEPSKTSTINFAPDNLINRTYLTAPDEDGQRFRAKIIQKIVEHEDALEQEPERVKFRGGKVLDEIVFSKFGRSGLVRMVKQLTVVEMLPESSY